MKIRYKSIISFASLAAIAPVMLSITSCNRNDIEYIAHRGLSSTFFQNTAASFAAAGQNSFFSAIETDIYLTKDYHIVCVHDENPFRDPTSLLHERSKDLVKDMNLEEAIARTLWTGYYGPDGVTVVSNEANEYGISGEYHVPTFRQYLQICSTYNKIPVIEIKDENGENLQILVSKMATQLNEFKLANKAQIIAFDDNTHEQEDIVKNELDVVLPNVNFQKLIWKEEKHENLKEEAYDYINRGWNIDMDSDYLDADIVKAAHKKHLKVNTWTVNDVATRDRVLAMGVDQVTGNFVLPQ